MAKEFLDYGGLGLYHTLITDFIKKQDIELKELNLTDDYKFEIHFTKGGEDKCLSLDLSSFVTEWEELK